MKDLELETALSQGIGARTTTFTPTWSLSEPPVPTRKAILPLVSALDLFLFAYQDHLGEVDNAEFLKQWVAKHRASPRTTEGSSTFREPATDKLARMMVDAEFARLQACSRGGGAAFR